MENFYDFLIVNNEAFSGSLTPHGKVPATASKIQWVADYSVEMTGFKICPRPTSVPGHGKNKTSSCSKEFYTTM